MDRILFWLQVFLESSGTRDIKSTQSPHLRVDLRLFSLIELIVRAESGSPGPVPRDTAIG